LTAADLDIPTLNPSWVARLAVEAQRRRAGYDGG
jgi:hypothetical protein